MKDFLKYTLATIVGLIACVVLISVISAVSIVGIVASSETTTTINDSCIFKLELKGTVTERLAENPFASIMSEEQTALGLDDILASIQKAADNAYIKGIYLEAGGIMASPASTEEIRNALLRFKQTGKFVVAYGGSYTETDYYICSVADKVILNPQGLVDWHGVASQTIYFKDLLAQLGIEMEVFEINLFLAEINLSAYFGSGRKVTHFFDNLLVHLGGIHIGFYLQGTLLKHIQNGLEFFSLRKLFKGARNCVFSRNLRCVVVNCNTAAESKTSGKNSRHDNNNFLQNITLLCMNIKIV